jgi:prolyl-tRNA synthetase
MKRVKLLSRSYLPLQSETPAGVASAAQRVLLQSGCVRALGSGLFSWLPYGHALLSRVAAVIEEEMEAVGFERCSFAALQPRALWESSSRWEAMGAEMFRLTDRRGAELALSPTAEEAFVAAASEHGGRLPVRLFQLGPKWRDEARPRAGVLRAREFVMKARATVWWW